MNYSTLLSSAVFAASATIFYKKNLRKTGLPVVMLLALLGLCIDLSYAYPNVAAVGCIVTLLMIAVTSLMNIDWVRSAAKLDLFLAFFIAIVDVKFNVCLSLRSYASYVDADMVVDMRRNNSRVANEFYHGPHENISGNLTVNSQEYAICMGIIQHVLCELVKVAPISWTKARIILVAVPQFVRRPIVLKNKLQGVRSKLGPIYVLYVVSYALSQRIPNEAFFRLDAWMCVAMAACFAGVFTRPDNSTMCDLVHFPSSYSCRKMCHKYLMIGTFCSCVLLFASEWLGLTAP